MEGNQYQQLAARTLSDRPEVPLTSDETMMVWCALGLTGEAGEVAELVKKGVFHRHGIDRDKLAKELGDVLWYVAGLCTRAGLTLEEVMALNIEKLKARYPEGFSSDGSINRVDKE
jgi:NTP pyrophosphatase (non-canonical NTP hydrolase)